MEDERDENTAKQWNRCTVVLWDLRGNFTPNFSEQSMYLQRCPWESCLICDTITSTKDSSFDMLKVSHVTWRAVNVFAVGPYYERGIMIFLYMFLFQYSLGKFF